MANETIPGVRCFFEDWCLGCTEGLDCLTRPRSIIGHLFEDGIAVDSAVLVALYVAEEPLTADQLSKECRKLGIDGDPGPRRIRAALSRLRNPVKSPTRTIAPVVSAEGRHTLSACGLKAMAAMPSMVRNSLPKPCRVLMGQRS